MNLRFVTFQSIDDFKLPGLLYEPKKKSKKAAIYLHGNGSGGVFYSPDKMNTIAEALSKKGIAFFPFNNRGANYIVRLKRIAEDGEEERVMQGTSYEVIRDCIFDIDGAIFYLKKQGYTEFYLIGESTGANKIVVYHYYKPKNPVSKYILLSGGDDTGLYFQEMGKTKFKKALKLAEKKIEKGREDELVPRTIVDYLFSWKALYDTLNPKGDYNIFPFHESMNDLKLSKKKLFREFKTIDKPTLVVYGELDEYCYGDVKKCVDMLKREAGKQDSIEYRIIKDADHGFSDHYKELAKVISSWLG